MWRKDRPFVCMLPTGRVRHRLRTLVGSEGITWCGLMVSGVDAVPESEDYATTCKTCGPPAHVPFPVKQDHTLRWSLRGRTMEGAPMHPTWRDWVQHFKKSHISPQALRFAFLGFVAGWFSLAEQLQLEEAA